MHSVWKIIFMAWVIIALSGCSLGSDRPPQASALPPTSAPTLAARADVTVVPKSKRPNILLILVDDLDGKLGTIDTMPHLQQLVTSQGLSLDDFMINTPVCCPSRATFLRGQYAHNHEVLTNSPPLGGFEKFYSLQEESSTLATWLQAAGYQTVLLGKYLNDYPFPSDRTYIPPGWNEWYSPAQGSPYKELNYSLNENGKITGYGVGYLDYLTDVLSLKTADFIRRSALNPRPFFIYLAPYAPHEPAIPARRDETLFPNLQVPRTPSFNEADVSDKPANIAADPPLSETDIANLDNLYRQRVRSMQAVDVMIASLVETLRETGQLDNTYIIFTSDNGYHMGQHRLLAGKGEPYEEDTVVPFIIRGPGIPADQTLAGYLASNTDVAPTIAELAGVIPPSFVDGRSLVPLWSADRPPETDWRQGYLLEYYGAGDSSGSTFNLVSLAPPNQLLEPPDPAQLAHQSLPAGGFFAIRTLRYTYAEYESGFRELYDRSQDPYELDNIASSADPGLLSQFSAWLKTLVSCSGAACRSAEQTGIH